MVINEKTKKLEKQLEDYLSESPSLEEIRSQCFLDPDGSNSKAFFKQMLYALGEVMNWYLNPGFRLDYAHLFEAINSAQKDEFSSEKEVNPLLSKEDLVLIQDANKINPKVLQEDPVALKYLLDEIMDLSSFGTRFNNKHIGQMHPHDLFPAYIAGIIGKFLNGNTISGEVSLPITKFIEPFTINWLTEIMNYGKNDLIPSGRITTGGTSANLASLKIAKNYVLFDINAVNSFNGTEKQLRIPLDDIIREGKEFSWQGVQSDGYENLKKKLICYVTQDPHYSIEDIAGTLGIGRKNVILLEKSDYKDEKSLKEKIKQDWKAGKYILSIIATAGKTETGEIDPLETIGKVANEMNIHFHVDAAHGGPFILSRAQGKFRGIELADTITIDPHKMLYSPYSAGAFLVKDKRMLYFLYKKAGYLFKEGDSIDDNLGQCRLECSMGLEGAMQTYAALRTLGKKGLGVVLNHTLDLTQYLYGLITSEFTDFIPLHEPDINLLCFRYRPKNKNYSEEELNSINREAQRLMYEEGKSYISNDNYHGMDVFRSVIVHPWTDYKDIREALKDCFDKCKEAEVKVKNGSLIKAN